MDPNIIFHFDSYESGPSGGLMMSLAIYNALVEEDITGGKKGRVRSVSGGRYARRESPFADQAGARGDSCGR